jgi:exosortase
MAKQHSPPPPFATSSISEKPPGSGNDIAAGSSSFGLKWMIAAVPLAYLWFRLVNNLRLEWTTNPQYSYGWVVPFLSLGLLLRRWQSPSEVSHQNGAVKHPNFTAWLFLILAFLYLPTRLVEEATPEWRPIQWSLGIEAIGLTLCAINLAKGSGRLRQFAFPICFFLVAIPWPSLIEQPVIQSLTRIGAAIVVEVMGWMGIPAVQHGNLIEVSTGTVGVSEACSGIRSFQTSLMISLFFGEFYRMKLARRLMLIPAGFVLAMAFNVCRMSFLTVVAARKGVSSVSEYHDPAGISITLVCTAVLWGLALLVKGRPEVRHHEPNFSNPISVPCFFQLVPLSLSLILWIGAVELGAELWYHHLESKLAPSPAWTVVFPQNNPTLKNLPIDDTTRGLLRFDEGKQANWFSSDGSRWQAFYCAWLPGRVAGYLAKRHTPEICLPATGWTMVSGPELTMMTIGGITLPVRSYVFDAGGNTAYVFHCRWEAGISKSSYIAHDSARYNLIRGIWAGRGNKGQKILEIVLTGYGDAEQAKAALARELPNLIKLEKPGVGPQAATTDDEQSMVAR